MTRPPTEGLLAARRRLGLQSWQVWLDYVGLGGNRSPAAIEMFLSDRLDLDDHDFDMVVYALNERLAELDEDHPLAYSGDMPPPAPNPSVP